MKKLILALCMTAAMSVGHAQTERQKPVVCFTTKALLKILMEEYKEKVIMMAKVDEKNVQLSLVVLYNPSKDTYSVVEMNNTNACLISSGGDVELSMPANIVSR